MSKKKNDEPVKWSRDNHSIFENFALELQEFGQTGVLPAHGDQDMRYCMELQKKRLEDKNIKMKYEFVPRGHFTEQTGMYTKKWSDVHYSSSMEYRTCTMTKDFIQNKKRLHRQKKNNIFYQIVTTANDMNVVGTELYACPNCDASSQIKVLQEGCPYCGTHFKTTDLFPKITSFFFVEDSGGTGKEVKSGIGKYIMIAIPLAFLFYYNLLKHSPDMNYEAVQLVLTSLFAGLIMGVIGGYLFWAISKLFKLFLNMGTSMPMVTNSAGSNKRFVNQMKMYSPEFSYEYFCNKVVSMLKMIIFAKNPQELPIYEGGPLGTRLQNIIDATYLGATALKTFHVEGNYCYVNVEVYMEDFYEENGRIRRQNDKFMVSVRKNIRRPINMHFSIRNIQCLNCNFSFDATKQKICPSCGSQYYVGDEDWVVLSVR